MANVPNGVEILPKISIAWVGRTNVTDRQTTDRQTDRRQHIANVQVSSRSLKTCRIVLAILANVNARSRSLYVVIRPSVVCLSSVRNVRAPYSDYWNFRQYFYAIWYVGHLLISRYNFTEMVPREPLRRVS